MPEWTLPSEGETLFQIEQQYDEISILIDASPPLSEVAGARKEVLEQHAKVVADRVTEAAADEGIPPEISMATIYTMGWIMGYNWSKRGH